jgi:hypothetical protein
MNKKRIGYLSFMIDHIHAISNLATDWTDSREKVKLFMNKNSD